MINKIDLSAFGTQLSMAADVIAQKKKNGAYIAIGVLVILTATVIIIASKSKNKYGSVKNEEKEN